MSFFCTAELCEEPGLALRATSLREKCFIKVSKGLLKLLECFEEKLSSSAGSAGHRGAPGLGRGTAPALMLRGCRQLPPQTITHAAEKVLHPGKKG